LAPEGTLLYIGTKLLFFSKLAVKTLGVADVKLIPLPAKIEAQPAGATFISNAEAAGIGNIENESVIRSERKKDFMRTCVG
jgi:hypothetical protein